MKPYLLVLAGGSGTRFWPRSRANTPKQLLPIAGNETLLVTTLRRFQGWIDPSRMIVLTTEKLRETTRAALADFPQLQLLCEPEAKNTAPCIAAAMQYIAAKDPEAFAVIVPADHWITDTQEYISCMQRAVEAADKQKSLITIGIQPSRPETGYGYIRAGEQKATSVYTVERFVEKPSKEVAETMVQHPEYLWNAGMFVWSVRIFQEEMKKSSPDLWDAFSAYGNAVKSGSQADSEWRKGFSDSRSISIDYALLEKSKNVCVIPGTSFGWNDLGSFVSLDEIYPKSEGGVARAEQVWAIDSMANIVDAPGKTVALLGVTDLILVEAGNTILLASRDRAQDVKKIVDRLKAEGRTDLL